MKVSTCMLSVLCFGVVFFSPQDFCFACPVLYPAQNVHDVDDRKSYPVSSFFLSKP